jgi:PAS domain-containing protein
MDLRYDPDFFNLLAGSFHRLTGNELAPSAIPPEEGARYLYEQAPFGLLAHDTAEDPIFVYGNKAAQQLFGYDWAELTRLPSRLSAEAPDRNDRQRFLERVGRNGFVSDYSGIRVTKTGRRFRIAGACVWQLIDAAGVLHGQAALLPPLTEPAP